MTVKPGTSISVSAQAKKVLVEKGVLTVNCTLQRTDYASFQDACAHLVSTSTGDVKLDLSRCNYVNSLFIGLLVDAVSQMKADGKQVSVDVSPEVGRFLHMAHMYHLFDYKIVEPRQ